MAKKNFRLRPDQIRPLATGRGASRRVNPVPTKPPPVRFLTKEWSIRLESTFERRVEDDCLVFWAPGRTIWISAWDAKNGESPEERLRWIKAESNTEPVERYEPRHPTFRRFGYLLMESDDEKGARWALYAFTVSPDGGHLQLAFYFDDKADLAWARSTWESIEFRE